MVVTMRCCSDEALVDSGFGDGGYRNVMDIDFLLLDQKQKEIERTLKELQVNLVALSHIHRTNRFRPSKYLLLI